MKSLTSLAAFAPLACGALALALAACGDDKPPPDTAKNPPPPPATATVATPTPPPTTTEAVTATPPPAPKLPEKVVSFTGVGLATPESVVYDATDDVYFVSNIQGKPTEADGKAFISKLSPDGKVVELKWIDAGKNKVQLNAPKGMCLSGDDLYVTDLTNVRVFDRKTGAPKKSLAVAGTTFLNDVVCTPGGVVYASDSGLKQNKAGGFEPTGTDAIFRIDARGGVKPLVKNTPKPTPPKGKTAADMPADPNAVDLQKPNGLVWTGSKLIVAPFGSADVYSVDPSSNAARATLGTVAKGGLDGLLIIGDDLLVSSWDASSVYRAKGAMKATDKVTFDEIITGVTSPADMGYDSKRNRLLVPLFQKDSVEVYDLK